MGKELQQGMESMELQEQEIDSRPHAGAGTAGNANSPLPQLITQPQVHQKALQQLMQTLRSPTSHNQQQEILQILKSNPPLMAAFIKQRQEATRNKRAKRPGQNMKQNLN